MKEVEGVEGIKNRESSLFLQYTTIVVCNIPLSGYFQGNQDRRTFAPRKF